MPQTDARVARGWRLLIKADRHSLVDPRKLGEESPLTQAYGSDAQGLQALGLAPSQAAAHGFAPELTGEWHALASRYRESMAHLGMTPGKQVAIVMLAPDGVTRVTGHLDGNLSWRSHDR